jgi:hypothetical protein
MEAVQAARAGDLVTLLAARGRRVVVKVSLLDRADMIRAPDEVVLVRREFLCGGRSGLAGQSQPMDTFHEETERILKLVSKSPACPLPHARGRWPLRAAAPLAGESTSFTATMGSAALLDHTKGVRIAFFEQAGIMERPNRPRTIQALEADQARVRTKLEASNYLKPAAREAVTSLDGLAMAATAGQMMAHGAEQHGILGVDGRVPVPPVPQSGGLKPSRVLGARRRG